MMTPMSKITATYQIDGPADALEAIAHDIAIEQTVEVPEEIITDPQVVGKIAGIEGQLVTIEYDAALANRQLPQFLNLVAGNVSMKSNIKLVDLLLPDEFLGAFKGPNYGVDGLRELLGVYGRPLLSTAIKPRGAGLERFTQIAREFALGGGDIVKDDHNLVDDTLDAFRQRVVSCQQAVERANDQTGRRCLYFPYISAPVDRLEAYAECVIEHGVCGILISPMLVGIDAVRHLAEKYPLVIMTHPTMTGTFYCDPRSGIAIGLLLGTLLRLAGADISVFVNTGGRFNFTPEQCVAIADRLREPLGSFKTGWPCPGGGMHFENISDMARQYGEDTVMLVGGALLTHGDCVSDSTRAFACAVGQHFDERLAEPVRRATGRVQA